MAVSKLQASLSADSNPTRETSDLPNANPRQTTFARKSAAGWVRRREPACAPSAYTACTASCAPKDADHKSLTSAARAGRSRSLLASSENSDSSSASSSSARSRRPSVIEGRSRSGESARRANRHSSSTPAPRSRCWATSCRARSRRASGLFPRPLASSQSRTSLAGNRRSPPGVGSGKGRT